MNAGRMATRSALEREELRQQAYEDCIADKSHRGRQAATIGRRPPYHLEYARRCGRSTAPTPLQEGKEGLRRMGLGEAVALFKNIGLSKRKVTSGWQ